MLVSLPKMLADAEAGQYAVIAPDFPNLLVLQLLIEQAERLKAPLLLSFAPSLRDDLSPRQYARFIRQVREEAQISSVPLGLHLDHAFSMDDIKEAVDLGFTSVMIDASRESWDVNVERTQAVVAMAHQAGVAVESELGHVAVGGHYGGQEDQEDHQGWLTDPGQAAEFVKQTGVDALAVAVGTIHGAYTGKPNLDFDRLKQINQLVDVPLVLHGASGTGSENLKKVVSLGIRKINVFSDLINALRMELISGLQAENSLNTKSMMRKAVQAVLEDYLESSCSIGQVPGLREDPVQRAEDLFMSGYTCSESIFMAFSSYAGFASDVASQALSMYGGGYGGRGGICGAVSGALAVIGVLKSTVNAVDLETRAAATQTANQFMDWFKDEVGNHHCKQMTGINFHDPDDIIRFEELNLKREVCVPAVRKTAAWLKTNLKELKS